MVSRNAVLAFSCQIAAFRLCLLGTAVFKWSILPLSQDTFQDYQEMFVQFGYVVLFSSAFPLAAMCALINNIIEIRSDAFKLCTGLQRPFGIRVESIGQWQVRNKYTINLLSPKDIDNQRSIA